MSKLPKVWESWRALKKLPQLIEAGIEMRNARKELEERCEALAKEERALKEYLIANFKKDELTEVKTKLGCARLTFKDVPQVEDWVKLYAFIIEPALTQILNGTKLKPKIVASYLAGHGQWDLIQKRAGERACQERWNEKVEIPGVKKFNKMDLKLGDAE